jgi:hypothetical protein
MAKKIDRTSKLFDRRQALGLLAASTSLLGSGAALANAAPGVAAKSIRIGVLGSLTGPLAVFGSGNLAGATLAFEQANAAGGVNGRQIEWVSLDDESSPPKGVAAFKRLVDQEKVFAVFGPAASAVGQALVPTDPPPLNWSTLKYVFWQTGGPQCRRSATSPKRSSRSCARSMCSFRRANPLPTRSVRSA